MNRHFKNAFRITPTLVILTACQYVLGLDFRTIDGSGNNLEHPGWGRANIPLMRLAPDSYQDGISSPRGGDPSSLPSPRAISNSVAAQGGSVTYSGGISNWVWQWGQFLSHDISLTGAMSGEPFPIPVPEDDLYFDPHNTGDQTIRFVRSTFDPSTGTSASNPREQINQITAYIDGSNVYGSDMTRAEVLRDTVSGNGRLATSSGNLLPFNTTGLPNDGGTSSSLFLAGDIRANEQAGLTAVHTLFVREHNRIAGHLAQRLAQNDPVLLQKQMDSGLSVDDFLYECARKVVGAQLQKITYEEFLPVLLGHPLETYRAYDASTNASIATEFSTAGYRIGHTMLPPILERRANDGSVADEGHLPLADAFFSPDEIISHGIDSLLLGLASSQAQLVDTLLVNDVRNFLFGRPGEGGFDLASLNIQRGRDHGIPTLNEYRVNALGKPAHSSFLQLAGGDLDLANDFASVYDSVDDVDLWIGGLAETHVNGGIVGETFGATILDQFARIRDGDRFFYQTELDHLRDLDPSFDELTLSDIIRRNSTVVNIQRNVFLVPAPSASFLTLGFALLITSAFGRSRRGGSRLTFLQSEKLGD